jgi:hypothetical protein
MVGWPISTVASLVLARFLADLSCFDLALVCLTGLLLKTHLILAVIC